MTLLWAVGSVIGAWAVWWSWRRDTQVLAVAVIVTGWCVHVAVSHLRRGRRRRRILDSGIPTLQLDELGVRLRHPFGNLDGAALAWTDCAAVVVSKPPSKGRTPESYRAYVEFVPLSPDRVEGAPRAQDQRTEVFDRSPVEVRTIWTELTGVGRSADDVATWVRAHRPDLTLVDPLGR